MAADPRRKSGISHHIRPDGSSVYPPADMHTVRKQLAARRLSAGPPCVAPVRMLMTTVNRPMPTARAEEVVLDGLCTRRSVPSRRRNALSRAGPCPKPRIESVLTGASRPRWHHRRASAGTLIPRVQPSARAWTAPRGRSFVLDDAPVKRYTTTTTTRERTTKMVHKSQQVYLPTTQLTLDHDCSRTGANLEKPRSANGDAFQKSTIFTPDATMAWGVPWRRATALGRHGDHPPHRRGVSTLALRSRPRRGGGCVPVLVLQPCCQRSRE